MLFQYHTAFIHSRFTDRLQDDLEVAKEDDVHDYNICFQCFT